jgi:hypothetical protein
VHLRASAVPFLTFRYWLPQFAKALTGRRADCPQCTLGPAPILHTPLLAPRGALVVC